MGKIKNLENKNFGKLTAIKITEKPKHSKTKQRSAWWECKCECGNIAVVRSTELLNGDTKSCGCLKSPNYWESPLYKGCGELAQSHWSHIIYSATVSRNIEFNITIQYAWDLFLKQERRCFYTGYELILGPRNTKGIKTASLDRLNNKIGYIEGNVVWCRKDINVMKMDKDFEDFLKTCKDIVNWRKEYGNVPLYKQRACI